MDDAIKNLKKLKELLDTEAITEEEFTNLKRKILGMENPAVYDHNKEETIQENTVTNEEVYTTKQSVEETNDVIQKDTSVKEEVEDIIEPVTEPDETTDQIQSDHKSKKKSHKKWFIIVLLIAVMLVIGIVTSHNNDSNDTTDTTATTTDTNGTNKSWVASKIVVNTSESDTTTNSDHFSSVKSIWVHFILSGPSDEQVTIKEVDNDPYDTNKVNYSNAAMSNDQYFGWNKKETGGDGYLDPGEYTWSFYVKETGEYLGEVNFTITE